MKIVNALGQLVDSNTPAVAAGLYLYSDEAIAEMIASGNVPSCGRLDENGNYEGLRQGFIIVGSDENGQPIKVDTCSGNLVENHLPDVVIVDNVWKPYVKYVNAAVVLILVLLIVKNIRQ